MVAPASPQASGARQDWRSLTDAPLGEVVEILCADGTAVRAAFEDTSSILDAIQRGARAWRPAPDTQ